MGASLQRALDAAQRQGFVGRSQELAWFRAALAGEQSERVLFVYGPGGIGKTTLLDELRRCADDLGRRAVCIDGRDVAGTAGGVSEAALASGPPQVLLIDGYELLDGVDRAIREKLLPSLPAETVTVIAGRQAPKSRWSADPGWRTLVRSVDLSAFTSDESRQLLSRLGVGVAAHDRLIDLARGHPLALALLAEAVGSGDGPIPERLADAPDLVEALCPLLIDEAPDDDHARGLATCAHAYRTTEDLLEHTVGVRAPLVWRWLLDRPFVRLSDRGLYPHDLVHEVFEAEFAQRAPNRYRELHQTIRRHVVAGLRDPATPDPDRLATELLFLHRHSPLATTFGQIRVEGAPAVVRGGADDHLPVLRLIADNDGVATADLAARWLAARPHGLYVSRGDTGIVAFTHHVYVGDRGDIVDGDALTNALFDHVEAHAPLRCGERLQIGRFLGAPGGYQRAPAAVMAASVSSLIEWTSQPAAWSFACVTDADFWRDYFAYISLAEVCTVGCCGRAVTAFGWDRRRLPIDGFLELTGRRELTGDGGPPPTDLVRPEPLSLEAFAAAVRAALRDLHRPDHLARSPLVTTVLADADGMAGGRRVDALRATIRWAIAEMGRDVRDELGSRVLDRTYLRGAPSQEAAAEVLDLAFSTYRRHLSRATDRLIDLLWAIEIGEVVPFAANRG